ncbi:MAG TPA: hypothetical protein VGQ72_15070 [Pyrinomonadaceae bacterium]|nr:hypothetical protein [Pyrinomonadaceae bacterium]
MITNFLLLDVRPDPVSTGIGVTGLILIGVVVLMLTAAAITGFVFSMRWFLRAKLRTNAAPERASKLQPSSPNQP